MGKKHKVLIFKCAEYDPDLIRGIVLEGMQELNVRPTGKTMLKPNTVIAHRELFPHAFTRPEFIDGVAAAVRQNAGAIEELAIGERSGITLPTRFCFRNAGYLKTIKKHRLKVYYFDESRHVQQKLTHPDRIRDTIYIPEPVKSCDFLINLPKFKAHPWCRITLSLKNYIGLQDDRHRLVDHNSYLNDKIADLQEVVESKFIAVDAISAGQRMMLTPVPFPMNAVIMGTNSCAVDTVGCAMVNLDSRKVDYLQKASFRGYGPSMLEDIEVEGDYRLEEIQEHAKDFEFCFEKIDSYFNDKGNMTGTVGEFPEKFSKDYCWGGCPGALQEALHIYKNYYPDVLKIIGKVRYVVGNVKQDITLEKGEKVLFVGNCTQFSGKINGKPVTIGSRYRKAEEVNVHKTASNDMVYKIVRSLLYCFRKRKSDYYVARGCPVSVAEHVNYLSYIGSIKNVNFDFRNVFSATVAYLQMRFFRLINRFR